MAYYPLNFEKVTWVRGSYSPASVKSLNNLTFRYWERSLYDRICSRISWSLPANWQGSTADFFKWCLYRFGYLLISQNDEYGYFFQPAQLSGFDFYYQPVRAIVGNPKMQRTFTIHEDCEILKLTPDYFGIWDIIQYYAEKLAALDTSIQTAIINSKYAFILAGKTRAAVETLKVIMDQISKGEPAVYTDRALFQPKPNENESPFVFQELQDLKENYVLDKLLKDFQTIINSFDAEIGIVTVPYQKAERLVTAEADSKTNDSQARIETWRDSLETSLDQVKQLYPDIPLSFKIAEQETAIDPDPEGSDTE